MKKLLMMIVAAAVAAVAGFAHAETNITESLTLTAATDWSDQKVRLAQGASIDLNGHSLSVGGFAEYLPLEYVVADGNQWVNTRFTPANTDIVETKVRFTSNANQFFFCSRSGGNNGTTFSLYLATYSGNSGKLNLRPDVGSAPSSFSNFISVNTDYVVTLNANSRKCIVCDMDGNTVQDIATQKGTLNVSGPFALFGSHTAGGNLNDSTTVGNKAHCRFYYFKVYASDGTTLKCDIIPVYGINERAVGLYDRVSGRFLPVVGSAFAGNYYPELEYIDTDGHQWINTLYRANCTNAVEMKASVANVNKTQFLYCNRRTQSGNGSRYYSLVVKSGKTRFDYQENQGANYSLTSGQPYVFSALPNTDTYSLVCKVDDNDAGTVVGAYFTPDPYFCLFGSYAASELTDSTSVGNLATCRFYWFKVYDTKDKEVLKCDIVPAYSVTDEEFGLYDRVAGRFLPNKGSSPFPNPLGNVVTNSAVAVAELTVNAETAVTNSITAFATNINFVKTGNSPWAVAGGLDVYGTFKSAAGVVDGLVLQDGATLDLSALSDAFSLDDNAVSFADGASITIDLGSRTASSKSPLVSWTVPPANLGTLKFIRAAGATRGIVVKSDGIYLAPKGLIISFF